MLFSSKTADLFKHVVTQRFMV